MEIEMGFSKFDNIKSNAYWTRVHFDTRLRPDVEDSETYKAHLNDCYNHPTTGLLVERQYLTKKPMNYPTYAIRNKKIMENDIEISTLLKDFKNKLKTLYPKTRHLRQYIIDNDRVMLDYIEPAKRYTLFDKIKIALRCLK